MLKLRIATALIALSVLATTAQADIWKNYQGASCQANTTDWSYSSGRIDSKVNLGFPVAFGVYCPIVRDYDAGGIDSGSWVRVIDRHYDLNVTCTLRTRYNTGGSLSYSSRSSEGSSTSAKKLTFGYVSNPGTEGTAELFCTVPSTYAGNRSGVVSYQIR